MVKNLSKINHKLQKCKPQAVGGVVMMLGGLPTSRTPSKRMHSYLGQRQGANVPAGFSALL